MDEKSKMDFIGQETRVERTPQLTLRDHFAAAALQGFLSSATIVKDGFIITYPLKTEIVSHAYSVADAMLAQREVINDE